MKKKRKIGKKRNVEDMRGIPLMVEEESEACSIDDNLSEEDVEGLCGTCGKSFQKDFSGEEWIKCSVCYDWYHMECQGLTPDKFSLSFRCDECMPLA